MNHMILWYLTSVLMIRSCWFQITYNEYGAREIILIPIESSAIVIFLSCLLVFISSLTYKFIEKKLQNGFK